MRELYGTLRITTVVEKPGQTGFGHSSGNPNQYRPIRRLPGVQGRCGKQSRDFRSRRLSTPPSPIDRLDAFGFRPATSRHPTMGSLSSPSMSADRVRRSDL